MPSGSLAARLPPALCPVLSRELGCVQGLQCLGTLPSQLLPEPAASSAAPRPSTCLLCRAALSPPWALLRCHDPLLQHPLTVAPWHSLGFDLCFFFFPVAFVPNCAQWQRAPLLTAFGWPRPGRSLPLSCDLNLGSPAHEDRWGKAAAFGQSKKLLFSYTDLV